MTKLPGAVKNTSARREVLPTHGSTATMANPRRMSVFPLRESNAFVDWLRTTRVLEWSLLSVLLLVVDYWTGPFVNFPFTFMIPVSLAAWHGGFRVGLFFALAMPTVRLLYSLQWSASETGFEYAFEFGSSWIIRTLVLAAFAFVMAKLAESRRLLSERVEILEGILPICSFCKKIRDDEGSWEVMEKYVAAHSSASFSHGVCDDCMKAHYGVDPGVGGED